jgi:hypothetical protein
VTLLSIPAPKTVLLGVREATEGLVEVVRAWGATLRDRELLSAQRP